MGDLNDSLSYALGAGALFDVSEDSDYVHTLLGKHAHDPGFVFMETFDITQKTLKFVVLQLTMKGGKLLT